jgi:anaerobic magnesium-protoporphyrin IX monomethyl ester cyclase
VTDCLLIGYNDGKFSDYLNDIQSTGTDSGAWRDVNLAFIEIEGKPHRSMDVLNAYRSPQSPAQKTLSNMDFFWPVITYLSTFVQRRGFSVDYVNLFQNEKEELRRKLEQEDILLVAITTTLYVSVQPVLEVVEFVRKHNRSAKIVVGGPFIYNQAQMLDSRQLARLFDFIGADLYVISTEGEQALANLLKALKEKSPLTNIDNIAFRDKRSFVRTGTSVESSSLVENMVDYDIFPQERFGEFVTLRTAKSCPFSCSFCGFPQRAGKYTYLGVEPVEKELDNIRRIGTVSTLTFIDDTFNVPLTRFKEIMRMMIRNNYGFRWNSYLRSDHTDAECIELMRQSGCEGVFLGAESGSDTMLKSMNKTSRREHYLRAIPRLRDAGIVTHCNLIVGFPGETLETFQETFSFIEEAQPDFYRAQLWYCDPTTPVWKKREEIGIKGSAFNWTHPTMDAVTAAKLVDQLFLEIKNSNWLPQHGFELWSVFYLQRLGMSLGHVKEFVRRFNDVVKFKLQSGPNAAMDRNLLEQLISACRYQTASTQYGAPLLL